MWFLYGILLLSLQLYCFLVLLVSIPHQTTHFWKFLERIPKSSCLSFLALFSLQLCSHPVLFNLNLVNYSLSFPFKRKIKFCFNICTAQITNIVYTSVCFPAHKKLNLLVYTITNVPTLDTWYSFLCLYYNQIMVWIRTGLCHLWCRCVCGSYWSIIMCNGEGCHDILITLFFSTFISIPLHLPISVRLSATLCSDVSFLASSTSHLHAGYMMK